MDKKMLSVKIYSPTGEMMGRGLIMSYDDDTTAALEDNHILVSCRFEVQEIPLDGTHPAQDIANRMVAV